MADVAPLTGLLAGGWYFGIVSSRSNVQGVGAQFNPIEDPQMRDPTAIGRSLLLRLEFGNGGGASGGV
ncbi:MAG: hypothetical protein OXC27_12925 [Caldilineaceae bacterium]|nr:hypothetical protein [Caldilineaceae bacterium]